MKRVELRGDALKLLYQFIDYGKANPGEFSELMYYYPEDFVKRLRLLEKAVDDGEKIEED